MKKVKEKKYFAFNGRGKDFFFFFFLKNKLIALFVKKYIIF